MKFLLQVTGLILMFAFVLVVLAVGTGIAAIKMAVDAVIGWLEGKWHDRKN